MFALASHHGFTVIALLLDEQATMAAVEAAIRELARRAKAGDTVWITYSGHGTQIRDRIPIDERSGLDSTWCLFDGMMVDDVLGSYWALFEDGVNIIMLSDSCHSGTMLRALQAWGLRFRTPLEGFTRLRVLPTTVAEVASRRDAIMPPAIKTLDGKFPPIKASVLLMSGCQENQVSLDGKGNGLFTQHWKEQLPQATSYRRLGAAVSKAVAQASDGTQVPNVARIGRKNNAFLDSRPLLLTAA